MDLSTFDGIYLNAKHDEDLKYATDFNAVDKKLEGLLQRYDLEEAISAFRMVMWLLIVFFNRNIFRSTSITKKKLTKQRKQISRRKMRFSMTPEFNTYGTKLWMTRHSHCQMLMVIFSTHQFCWCILKMLFRSLLRPTRTRAETKGLHKFAQAALPQGKGQ